ncbi:hypothetical protein F2Q68_00006218 [Brassica cretica]|uniref:Uncharacterized protein n=1 Tax=Brassica cretica TaxID=69181 RepID=A0A8S9J979_BRACR|nr:hypothetical protein F2Q68_00006218 [Brassica cretica]
MLQVQVVQWQLLILGDDLHLFSLENQHCTQAAPLALSPTLPSSSRAFTLCQQLRLSSSVHRCEAAPIVAPRHRQATSKLSDGTTTLSWNVIIVYYRVLGSIRKRHETIAM